MAGTAEVFEQVMDLVEGRLGADEAAVVRARIESDTEWRSTHAWITRFMDATAAVLPAVPAETRGRLEQLLPARPSFVEEVQRIGRTFATLIRDMPSGVAFAGARGATGTHRQLLFGIVDGVDLVIDLDVAGDVLHLGGQLLGAEAAMLTCTADEGTSAVVVDEFGEFRVELTDATFVALELTTNDIPVSIDLTPYLDAEA